MNFLIFLFSVSLAGCHTFRTKPIDFRSSMARELTCDGIDALQCGNHDQAEKLLAQAVRAAPRDQRIRAEWSRALANQGQLSHAIEQMKLATELAPDEASFHVELGRLYLRTARLDLAEAEADLALATNRDLADAWALKGSAMHRRQQLSQAKTFLHRAVALQPNSIDYRFELAQIYDEMELPQRALVVLEGLRRDANSQDFPNDYFLLRSKTLAAVGQLDQAATTLVDAMESGVCDDRCMLELSRIQMERGDVQNARLTLLRGQQLYANNPEFTDRLESLPAAESAQTASRF